MSLHKYIGFSLTVCLIKLSKTPLKQCQIHMALHNSIVYISIFSNSQLMSVINNAPIMFQFTVWRETLVVGKFGELSAKLPLAE